MSTADASAFILLLRAGMVLCLFLFLALICYTQWIDLKRLPGKIPRKHDDHIFLLIKEENVIISHRFSKEEITIGNDGKCKCVIKHQSVSNHHVTINFSNNRWWIRDMNSGNGTFVDNRRIKQLRTVKSGSSVRCGDIEIMILIDD